MTQQTPWSPQQPQWGQQNPNSSGAPPQIPFEQPQWGQFQPQPPPYYPLPPNKQQRPWYKKQGILIALVCTLFLLVLLLGYGVTTIGQTPTPAATATPSGQLTAASPTAQPTLASTPLATPTAKVQVTPTAALTPTAAPTPTPKPKPTTVKVKVYNSGFSPTMIMIPVGSTLIWTNNGGIAHTVTDDHKAFDSGDLPTGATFQFTFNKRGTYHYVCTYHPNMVGTIIVM